MSGTGALDMDSRAKSSAVIADGSPVAVRSPYFGPRPFEEGEKLLFFGRESDANELLSLVTAYPMVLLYSVSGAGKTSLVNARLIPMLRGETFDRSHHAHSVDASPSNLQP